MQNGVIRRAALADLDAMVALHRVCFQKAAWQSEQIKGSLDNLACQTWLYDDGAVLGLVMMQTSGDEGEILTFCVAPDARWRGIASQLFQAALAAAVGIKTVFLEVAADNQPAQALYEKLGFVKNGCRPRYYRRENGVVDAVNYIYKSNR